MNKNENAVKQLIKGNKNYIDKIIKDNPRDISDTAIVIGASDDGYTILLNNVTYNNIQTIGGTCIVNEVVRVCAPQGNYNNLFILKGGSGGSGGDVTSVNSMTGDVVITASGIGALTTETLPTMSTDVIGCAKIDGTTITITDGVISAVGGGTTDYAVLSNKPSVNGVTLSGNKTSSELGINVPTKTSDIANDSGFITKSVNDLTNYTKTSSLSTVATSGSYTDLLNKPTIPTKTSDLSNDSGFITSIPTATNSVKGIVQADGTTTTITNGVISAIGGGGGTSDYSLLLNKPSINGVELSGNKTTADLGITIPSKTSDLTNDSHMSISMQSDTTSSSSPSVGGTFTAIDSVTKDTYGHVTKVNTKTVTLPTQSMPTKTSDLTNDSNFVADANYVHTDNNFTNTYKEQLDLFQLTVNLDGSLNLVYNGE